jgi:hypothetical protein
MNYLRHNLSYVVLNPLYSGFNEIDKKKIGTFWPSLADLSVDVKITCRSFVSKESF